MEVRLFAVGVLLRPEGPGTETGDLLEGDPNRFEGRCWFSTSNYLSLINL